MRRTNLTFGQNGDEVKPLTTNEIKPLSEDERRTLSRMEWDSNLEHQTRTLHPLHQPRLAHFEAQWYFCIR